MIKPITTFAVIALAICSFAQSQTVKIRSKGDDLRTVIDSVFEQVGKQYVLETNYRQTLYMNLDGVSFAKAIQIISSVTDMEFEERESIWYVHKKSNAAAQKFVKESNSAPKPTSSTITKPTSKSNAPAKTTTNPPAKKVTNATNTAGQKFDAAQGKTTPIAAATPKLALTGKLTVQLKKMDIREVFAELGRQTNVEIELDEAIPNYKLDAFFYNTSLKFALDRVCKIAGLKYSTTPRHTIRISKA